MVDRDPDKTRQALLFAAFTEINQNGFQAASLNNILKETAVTKGALYHHFPSKLELGYAVVDELIWGNVKESWVTPLIDVDNIIDALLSMIDRSIEYRNEDNICFGCPLNNLAQEMSPIDEGFRERINHIFDQWRAAITDGLIEGQANSIVKKTISAEASAYFIVAAIEGATSLAKNAKSVDVLRTSLQGLKEHIQTLRK
ncbi:MAG: TetR/AcrR family transcriptional regulator [Proteobacteria bacterium]|nr:TetR/AcrR family transcriptional regulator [Pseudomonadota bacterium]NOG61695.1 TetR/AcrR family transcriptional regulator [Pseudomonadota bacterium]